MSWSRNIWSVNISYVIDINLEHEKMGNIMKYVFYFNLVLLN